MPEPAQLAGTRPLASCKEHLRDIDARLDVLSGACTRRCEALLAALQRLPQAASFEPFPAAGPGPASAPAPADSGAPRSRPRRTSQAPSGARPAAAPPGSFGQGAFAGIAQALAAISQPDARAALLAQGALQDLATGGPAAAPGALAALPQAAGLLVEELLARVPAPLPSSPPGQGPGLGSQLGDPAEAQFSRMLGKLIAQGTGRPPAQQSAPARQAKRKPTAFGPAVAAAVAEALARHPEPPPQASGAGGLFEGLAQTLPVLLPRLLEDLAQAPEAGAARQAPAADPSRSPAPRAQARLVEGEGAPPGKQSGGSRKAAPAGDPQPAEDGGELVRQLNRLLLDQAWLRGVDLT